MPIPTLRRRDLTRVELDCDGIGGPICELDQDRAQNLITSRSVGCVLCRQWCNRGAELVPHTGRKPYKQAVSRKLVEGVPKTSGYGAIETVSKISVWQIIRPGERYFDDRGKAMWDTVTGLLAKLDERETA